MSEIQGFVDVRCLCGKTHTFLRDRVLDGLGVGRWRCGSCKRRFVIACTPGLRGEPEAFWPLFLEQVPSTGDTKQEGLSTDASPASPPAELHFRCRCACRLVARPAIYGQQTRCPRCRTPVIVRVGYESDDGKPVALLEYPEGGAIGQPGS